MSFLQPWLLAALPLVSLPIIIHLINQRRFQTIPWAAMMFLMAAHRMSRGYSRLRQWLIMLMRMAAVGALIFAVSRPLASGWLGLVAGGHADTTIVVWDRSPSMQQRDAASGRSKLETGRTQLAGTLGMLGAGRFVLIDSANNQPWELSSPEDLEDLPATAPTSAAADLPALLQTAYDYIRDNRVGRTEIWICSDLRENDWTPQSGRWATLRDAFLELPQGVRVQLLAYPRVSSTNSSVRVTNVRRQETSDGAELVVSLRLSRPAEVEGTQNVPVQFEIEGARSVVPIEMTGPDFELTDHRIPIERSQQHGWGRVSIPADENPADDDFYFVFDDPPPRRAIVVAEDAQAERPLLLAAGIAPEASLRSSAEPVDVEQLPGVAWDEIALVLWQAPLPTGAAAELLQSFVDRGGQVVFLPPGSPTSDELFGMRWLDWNQRDEPIAVETWRSDEDLLARSLSGAALPVGQLEVRRYCAMRGEATALATLRDGATLVARVPTRRGGVYFWATTPAPRDSSLATGGVVMYAFLQRAMAAGSAILGKARLLDAGPPDGEDPATWNCLAEGDEGLSTEASFRRGVYAAGDRLLAVNRPAAEDDPRIVSDERVDELFRGLDFVRVDDQAGNLSSLIQEIWRVFLVSMLVAILVEGLLCLPKRSHKTGGTA